MRRSSPPAGSAAAQKSSAKTTSPEGSDSGYGSTANATDGFTTDHLQDFADGVALPSRRIFERKVTKLRLFDREIPQLTQHRFHDLHELFERPLCDHLIEAKVNPHPISLKLKVLGESEATAKPWIVVLCNKTASKRVRHFFNQQHIKADYQPSNPDSFLPSFEIFVCNRPPRPMAGTAVYGDFDRTSTMCGNIIKVGEADQSRLATLGGLIKVIHPSGTVMLYGMTAGHILAEEPPGQYSFDHVDVPDEEDDEDEGFYSGEEEYELDDTLEGEEEVQDLATTGEGAGTVAQSTQLGILWPKVGGVSATSKQETKTENDHDWALIAFDEVTEYRPNLLVPSDSEEKAARTRPLKENGKATEDGSNRKALLLSGTGGVKAGILSTSLSFLMMGPAKAFTKTYTLALPHGSVLNAGDCGSWVVDESTCEVYGHVVASDAMGDTYVVPLNATLRDMEGKLGAAVCLPTEADIHTWLAQHAKAVAEEIAVPVANVKKNLALNDSKIDPVDFLGDLQNPAGHSAPQAPASPLSLPIRTSTPITDYCTLCNAKFKGSQQDVKSNLRRHRRTCSKQDKHPTSLLKTPTLQSAKYPLDEISKSSSLKPTKSIQQKAENHTSRQQPSPVPWSIRSMYSNFRKASDHASQQKDKSKSKSIGKSEEGKLAGSASSTKSAATTSPASTAEDPRKSPKDSNSMEDWASPALSKKSSAPAPGLASSINEVVSPGPISGSRPSSLSAATPSLPHIRRGVSVSAPPPRSSLLPVHGHKSSHKRNSDSRHQSHKSNSEEISYEGYTFTKCKPQHAGQKETWAVAHMVPMPVSQADLKDQITRSRKKHLSALDEYNDEKMKGFKQKQVDNLIRERTNVDGDYGYEYMLASIKLDPPTTKTKYTKTLSMQVILKRQLIAGFPHETSAGTSVDIHAKLPSQIMDLTREDELGVYRGYGDGNGSQVLGHYSAVAPFPGHPGNEVVPLPPRPGRSFVDNRIPPFQPVPNPLYPPYYSPVQGMRQPPVPPPSTIPSHSVPLIRREIHSDQGDVGEAKTSSQIKKTSKVVDARHETRTEHKNASSSSSLSDGLDSDNSWITPATLISDQSRGNSEEQRVAKGSKEGSHTIAKPKTTPIIHEIERPVYHEHIRGEHRRSPLARDRRPRDTSLDSLDLEIERRGWRAASARHSYGTRYGDHTSYDIEPAVSFPADRSSRHRRRSVSPERPSHRRASSYNLGDPLVHNSRALVSLDRRPAVYREAGGGISRGIDSHEYIAELRREQERWDRGRMQLASEEDELAMIWSEIERDGREERRAREKKREMERKGEMDSIRELERMKERERMEEIERMREMARRREMDRMKDMESRGSTAIERERWGSGTTYDDGYVSRRRRDRGYYY